MSECAQGADPKEKHVGRSERTTALQFRKQALCELLVLNRQTVVEIAENLADGPLEVEPFYLNSIGMLLRRVDAGALWVVGPRRIDLPHDFLSMLQGAGGVKGDAASVSANAQKIEG